MISQEEYTKFHDRGRLLWTLDRYRRATAVAALAFVLAHLLFFLKLSSLVLLVGVVSNYIWVALANKVRELRATCINADVPVDTVYDTLVCNKGVATVSLLSLFYSMVVMRFDLIENVGSLLGNALTYFFD